MFLFFTLNKINQGEKKEGVEGEKKKVEEGKKEEQGGGGGEAAAKGGEVVVIGGGGEKKEEKAEEEEKKMDPVLEMVKAYRAYNPHMTKYYYVQSMEENPNACIIC
uniref:Uncharacterized protein n=1 Tax=Kalanchoe fedtschenkoi TaxID=63787 RepID=A0A7N0VCI4_KALFE